MLFTPLTLTIQLKTDYNSKSNETEKKINDLDHDKYISTQEFNRLTAENFAARLKQSNLPIKNDIADFVKKANFGAKVTDIQSKYFTASDYNKSMNDIFNAKIKTKNQLADLIFQYS